MTTATLDTAAPAPDAPRSLRDRAVEELRFFAKLFAVMLTLFTLVFGHYKIPSESMQPTLEVGDHLYVSKHAYGYGRHSLPFGLHRLPIGDWHLFSRLPERGDVVVFRNTNNGLVTIKRVVGLPGDVVQVVDGRLVLDGTVVARTPAAEHLYRPHKSRSVIRTREFTERLPGEAAPHSVWEQSDTQILDNTEPFAVGENQVFLMGDNRDVSVDSRDIYTPGAPGLVDVQQLIGRAEVMMFSLNRCKAEEGLRCPGRRWFRRL